jgi:hypothetical protein
MEECGQGETTSKGEIKRPKKMGMVQMILCLHLCKKNGNYGRIRW